MQLPAGAVAGLATAAEGLAQAFRSMATGNGNGHAEVMDLEPDAWEIETHHGHDGGTGHRSGENDDEDYDADLGQPGPRHAR